MAGCTCVAPPLTHPKGGKDMKTITAFIRILTVLVATAVLASTGFAQDTVKLGINEVRSGAFTTNGDRVVWGVEAAVKEVNETGGIL
jgi:ABC-type branched-subunit amino acid transport system substrate-binding protein